MAVPKKRITRSRRGKRRYSHANQVPALTVGTCPECHGPRRPHHVCSCGYYDGRVVITPAPAEGATATT